MNYKKLKKKALKIGMNELVLKVMAFIQFDYKGCTHKFCFNMDEAHILKGNSVFTTYEIDLEDDYCGDIKARIKLTSTEVTAEVDIEGSTVECLVAVAIGNTEIL